MEAERVEKKMGIRERVLWAGGGTSTTGLSISRSPEQKFLDTIEALVKMYRKVTTSTLASDSGSTEERVRDALKSLVLAGRIEGHLDLSSGTFELGGMGGGSMSGGVDLGGLAGDAAEKLFDSMCRKIQPVDYGELLINAAVVPLEPISASTPNPKFVLVVRNNGGSDVKLDLYMTITRRGVQFVLNGRNKKVIKAREVVGAGADLEVAIDLVVEEKASRGTAEVIVDVSQVSAAKSIVSAATGLKQVRRVKIPFTISG
ncbi:MAG: hypothetical protein ACTSU5_01420 [Promethearchaeota archaeon]